MVCSPDVLRHVALFALLDDEELAVLAGQVELKRFAARERIYKIGDRSGPEYVLVSGKVRVTTVDEDQQEVVIDEPLEGEFFGFASMIDETPHQTGAIALEETVCIEVERRDITVRRQFHASQQLVRIRAMGILAKAAVDERQVYRPFPCSVRGPWAFSYWPERDEA